MSAGRCTFIFLAGAGGGGEQDIAAFQAGLEEPVEVRMLSYPGWRRYVARDFSAEVFLEELTAQIAEMAPAGPIHIMGSSIGGHLGYAAALRLEQEGREVACLCAIDSFMIRSALPSSGWQSRAASEGLALLRQGRWSDLAAFARSKFWRALLRLAGGRLPAMLRLLARSGWFSRLLAADKLAEQELSMRLMLRVVAPWIASLDRQPVPTAIPTLLLRTRRTGSDDPAWRRRCSRLRISEVPGEHLTLFAPQNIGALRKAFSAGLIQPAG